jgi:hypothetical protein
MLTRFHKILIALLAVQLLLVVLVLVRGEDTGALKEHPLLAGFDAAKVTRLQVFANATAKPVDLVKRDASWVLASGFDYPVPEAKVTDALAPIAKLAAAAPIATQTGRHKQLHVADDDFERKLVITRDGKDLTLFIGGAAGARHTAVRLGGDANVYGVTGLSVAQVSGEARQWVDPTYLKIPSDEIAQVTIQRDGKTVELVRSAPPAPPAAGSGSAGSGAGSGSSAGSGSGAGSGSAAAPPAERWNVTIGAAPVALASGESLDQPAIERLVGQVATIDLSAPADPKRDAAKPTATITIEHKAKDAATPAPTIVDVITDGESYWVHDRSLPRAALVDRSRLDDVLGADHDKVVKKPPPPPAPPPAPGAGSAARPS